MRVPIPPSIRRLLAPLAAAAGGAIAAAAIASCVTADRAVICSIAVVGAMGAAVMVAITPAPPRSPLQPYDWQTIAGLEHVAAAVCVAIFVPSAAILWIYSATGGHYVPWVILPGLTLGVLTLAVSGVARYAQYRADHQ